MAGDWIFYLKEGRSIPTHFLTLRIVDSYCVVLFYRLPMPAERRRGKPSFVLLRWAKQAALNRGALLFCGFGLPTYSQVSIPYSLLPILHTIGKKNVS